METGSHHHFATDAAGFGRFQRYLERHSSDPADFLILLEPTGSYGLTVLMYLLGKGYRVLQIENRAVKDYREKVFGSETKTDDTDARLMARMAFLHELVGEEFSIQPVLVVNPDAAALRSMVHDLTKLQKEITRRRNQLQQISAATFPELKTFFKGSTEAPAARALLEHFATPGKLAAAPVENIVQVLRDLRMPTAMRCGLLNSGIMHSNLRGPLCCPSISGARSSSLTN